MSTHVKRLCVFGETVTVVCLKFLLSFYFLEANYYRKLILPLIPCH